MAGRFQGVLQDEDSLAARMAEWKKIYCPPHSIHGVNLLRRGHRLKMR